MAKLEFHTDNYFVTINLPKRSRWRNPLRSDIPRILERIYRFHSNGVFTIAMPFVASFYGVSVEDAWRSWLFTYGMQKLKSGMP